MRVEIHSPMWNEETRLPWYLEHYGPLVDGIYLYDNFSSDRSKAIAMAHPKVTLRYYGSPELNNENMRLMKNNCWKKSRADWIIVADVDELLFHPDLRKLLETTEATVLQVGEAWDIISREIPEDWHAMRQVAPAPFYRKCFIFRRPQIKEINYGHGAHHADPKGQVRLESPPELLMLHYQFIGEARLVDRYMSNKARRSALDRQRGWGIHYDITVDEALAIFGRGTVDVWKDRSWRPAGVSE